MVFQDAPPAGWTGSRHREVRAFAMHTIRTALFALCTAAAIAQQQPAVTPAHLGGSYVMEFERGPINYLQPSDRDPVARLQRHIDSGDARLVFEPNQGYLRSLLENLGVPAASQALVFSKTSFQLQKIGPATPRAIYFGEDVYVGFVQHGDVLELSAVDPERGAMFYTLEQKAAEKPKFERHIDCLQCHAAGTTLGIPGHLVRSVTVDSEGQPLFVGSGFITDHNSPFRERWGGWYVTGSHGSERHMGNMIVKDRSHPDNYDVEAGANITALSKLGVDAAPYLEPHSDIVALMVLEHQTRGHNIITRVAFESRLALEWQESLEKSYRKDASGPGGLSESVQRRIFGPSETLLRYMLFLDEPALRAPVQGTSSYQQEFPKTGPRDSHGRSLRDLDLSKRLFRYPLSFLIYSSAFDALPAPAKNYIFRRLADVLSGADQRPEFAGLSASDRSAIREILMETKPQFAEVSGALR